MEGVHSSFELPILVYFSGLIFIKISTSVWIYIYACQRFHLMELCFSCHYHYLWVIQSSNVFIVCTWVLLLSSM